jgi:hypothetical protein
MGNDVSPSLSIVPDSVATEITLFWTIGGDTPTSINIQDECTGKTLAVWQNPEAEYKLTNLPVGVQYRLFLVANFADGGTTNSNVVERYANMPCAAAKPAPVPTDFPEVSMQLFPKPLSNSNRIVVSCPNAATYDHWMLMVNGVQSEDLEGDQTHTIDAVPGQTFTLATDGLDKATDNYTNWSQSFVVTAGKNSNSVSEFLKNSGVSGASGIKQYVRSSNSTGVRNMLGL